MKNNNFLENPWAKFLVKLQVRFVYILFWIICLAGFIFLSYISKKFNNEKSLSVYMWSDKIDESILRRFEDETGIKIYVNYYESNEELVTKFEIAKNLSCDIILPSEYIIKYLAHRGFLKKLNKKKCKFIGRIYPEFMNKDFDPGNIYSLPIYWDVVGFGYRKSYFKEEQLPFDSWKLVFDKELLPCPQISMVDDAREAIFIGATYFGWDYESLDAEQLQKITELFVRQKQWVGAYTDFQQGYFLSSKTYPLIVSQREVVAREMLKDNDIEFSVPKEGSLFILTNVVICASSEKDELIYKFLNYMYDHEILLHNCKEFCILPAVKDVLQALPQENIGIKNIEPGKEIFKRLVIFPSLLTQKQINDVWIAFKSS